MISMWNNTEFCAECRRDVFLLMVVTFAGIVRFAERQLSQIFLRSVLLLGFEELQRNRSIRRTDGESGTIKDFNGIFLR